MCSARASAGWGRLAGPTRQPATLPSCHRSSRTGPGPLAAHPDHSPACPVYWRPFCGEDKQPTVHTKETTRCPNKTIQLTPAQAQRLINTYCYVIEPDAVERLTRGTLTLYDTPSHRSLLEFKQNVYGELVSWLSWDEVDALIYGG